MKNYFRTILKLFCATNVSEQTKNAFYQWLIDDKHSAEKEEALKGLWKQACSKNKHSDSETQLSYIRLRERLGIPFVPPEEKTKRSLGPWQAVAAVLLVISSACIYMLIQNRSVQADLIEQYAPVAQTGKVTLPDGTCVHLNSHSTLLYPRTFEGKTRSVYLMGEANFKVARNEKQPFIVKSGGFQVTALGTEFNVCAYPKKKTWEATLVSGSVKVEYDSLRSHVVLHPSEQLVYNKQSRTYEVLRPDMQDVTAWQRGELVFSEMTLKEIVTVLERKYPYDFVYSLRGLKDDKLTFRFRDNASLEEVMGIVTKVAGDIGYRIDDRSKTCYLTPQRKARTEK